MSIIAVYHSLKFLDHKNRFLSSWLKVLWIFKIVNNISSILKHWMHNWRSNLTFDFMSMSIWIFLWWLDISLFFWTRVSKSLVLSLSTVLSPLHATFLSCRLFAKNKIFIIKDSCRTGILLSVFFISQLFFRMDSVV